MSGIWSEQREAFTFTRVSTPKLYYDITEHIFDYERIAKGIINKGWIKTNKDSVVLSREEYERLLKIKEEASVKETNYFSNLFKLQKELEQVEKERDSAIDNCDRKSKETAERDFNKIIKALEERKDRVKIVYGIAERRGIDMAIAEVERIAKQCGVEIKGQ